MIGSVTPTDEIMTSGGRKWTRNDKNICPLDKEDVLW